MPNTDKAKMTSNKKRLGRGLGSLLSTDVDDFNDDSPAKPQQQTEKKELKEKAPSPGPSQDEAKKTQAKTPEKAQPVPQNTSNTREISPYLRIWSLAVEKIVPNSTQPRKDFLKEPLEELAQSIKEQGVIQPITVRKKGEKYEIIAGERRWRASQVAGLQEIPAIIKDVDDQKSMELALIENLQREDLNPVEEAMGYQLLMDDYDLSQQELATKVGKSRSSVTNSLRVLTLPRDVRQMLRQGLLTLGHAKVLLGVEDVKDQVSLAKKTISKKLSVRALEKEVKKATSEKSQDFNGLDVSERLAKGLATDLQKILGTRVQIKYSNGKGKIEISYYSDDELSSLCEKIKNIKR